MEIFEDEHGGMPDGAMPLPTPKQSKFSNTMFLVIVIITVLVSNSVAFVIGMIVAQRNRLPVQYVIDTPIVNVSGGSASESVVAAASRAARSVVELRFENAATNRATLGSGVIVGAIESHPLVLTNYHVVAGSLDRGDFGATVTPAVRLAGSSAWIKNGAGSELLTVLGYESVVTERQTAAQGHYDIALLELKINVENVRDCILDSAAPAARGERVVSVGNALGDGLSVTDGVVSRPDFTVRYATNTGTRCFTRYLMHSAAINSGNSGGAVVDLDGNLLGINTAVPSDADGDNVQDMSYAVPARTAIAFRDRVLRQRALGVSGDVARTEMWCIANDVTSATMMIADGTAKKICDYRLAPIEADIYVPSYFEITGVGTDYEGLLEKGDRIVAIGGVRLFDKDGTYVYGTKQVGELAMRESYPSVLTLEELLFAAHRNRREGDVAMTLTVLRGGGEIEIAVSNMYVSAV